MPKKIFLLAALSFLLACNNDGEGTASTAPENDVDAARTFIRYALDGKWKEAKRLVVQDSANLEDIDLAEQNYTQRTGVSDQRGLRESTIRIFNTQKLSDSVSVVIYANTFRNKKDSVKVIKQGGAWLVDLKYSFPSRNAVHP